MKATSTLPTPYQHTQQLRRGLRASVIEGIFAGPIVTMSLPANVFTTSLVVKAFPLSKLTIGNISSMPFVCNFLQVLVTPLVARWLPARGTAIAAAGLHTTCWAWLGWKLPDLSVNDPVGTGRFLLIWFFFSSLFNSVLGVVWNGWMHDLVPARIRGRYFSRRNRIGQGSILVFVLSTGIVLSWGGYSIKVFQGIIAGACLCRYISLYFFALMPGKKPAAPEPAPAPPLLEQFRIVRRSSSLLLFIAFGAVWSFGANCFGPFYHVFMFEQLNFSATQVGVLATLTAFGGMISLPVWGGLLDRFGNRAAMAVALALWQIQNLLWCTLTPANSVMLYGIWFWGGCLSAGFVLGQFTLLMKLLPVGARNLAIGLNLAVTSLFAAVSPIVGGQTLEWLFSFGHDPLDTYHLVFIFQPVVAGLACILLLRIKEPASSSFSTVVGAMRNIRTLSGVLGLSFFVNYLFVKPTESNSRSGSK